MKRNGIAFFYPNHFICLVYSTVPNKALLEQLREKQTGVNTKTDKQDPKDK